MKASELVSTLQKILKANQGFDPEIRIVGDKTDQGLESVGQCFDYILIETDSEPYVPCSYCGEISDRLCNCDK